MPLPSCSHQGKAVGAISITRLRIGTQRTRFQEDAIVATSALQLLVITGPSLSISTSVDKRHGLFKTAVLAQVEGYGCLTCHGKDGSLAAITVSDDQPRSSVLGILTWFTRFIEESSSSKGHVLENTKYLTNKQPFRWL